MPLFICATIAANAVGSLICISSTRDVGLVPAPQRCGEYATQRGHEYSVPARRASGAWRGACGTPARAFGRHSLALDIRTRAPDPKLTASALNLIADGRSALFRERFQTLVRDHTAALDPRLTRNRLSPALQSADRDPPRHRLLRLLERQGQHPIVELRADLLLVDLARQAK